MGLFSSKWVAAKMVVVFAAVLVGQNGFALAGSDRIYPSQRVTLHRGDQMVGVYHREAPLPEGLTLVADGRCAVKLDDLYLVAEDRSVFSIRTSARHRNVLIEKGTIYFKTAAINRVLSFYTPAGPITVQRIRLNAAFGAQGVKGYVSVSGQESEMGIAEGGSMDVLLDEGWMTIQSGQKIILAQAIMDIGPPESEPEAVPPPPETDRGLSSGQKIAVGALGVGAIGGILIGLSGGGSSDGGGEVSPSSPR